MDVSIRFILYVLFWYQNCRFGIGSAVMIYPSYEVHQVPLHLPYNAYNAPFNNIQLGSEPQIARYVHPNSVNIPKSDSEEGSAMNYERYHINEQNKARTADAEEQSSQLMHRNAYDDEQPNVTPISNQPEPKDATSSTKISFQSPDLTNLLKPITIKATSTSNGLMDLVTAFLSSSPSGNVEMKGFKDLVINGIIKPLLVAKGGLKTLISKLTIPLIALLLINVEVLVIVWWLWEDCTQYKQPQPTYTYPNDSYSKYNASYR